MMKSIMISIKPKWCELIASGKKTIEIRKTRPKIDTPFRCYIYCTKEKDISEILWTGKKQEIGKISDKSNGKVIGEFVCDEIMTYAFSDVSTDVGIFSYYERYVKNDCDCDCLTDDEIIDYGNGVTLYGWHISELKIYDEPKELCEFSAIDNHEVKKCQNRIEIYYKLFDLEFIKSDYYCARNNDRCIECKHKMISKPPTSWCYVDELK